MKTEPLTVISKALCVGLLVLAGILSSTQPRFGAVAGRVHASRWRDFRRAAGRDRAAGGRRKRKSEGVSRLAVRDRFRAGAETPEETFYIACLLREEGSPWRSGSTYLVTLTPDGGSTSTRSPWRSRAGCSSAGYTERSFKRWGIDPADLADPAAGPGQPSLQPGPGTAARSMYQASPGPLATRSSLPRPDSALRSFCSREFDLDATHLAAEQIDYGDPTVTAAEVVDRETLKAFVTQGGRLHGRHPGDRHSGRCGEDQGRLAGIRTDPGGMGSVYLYALDLTSNINLFHGAFPDRYENRPLTLTVRDAVTGESILPQLIEAAKSSPEGGFVEYYFDDPNDDNDSADIPKTGFAREFTARVGPQATIKFRRRVRLLRACTGGGRRGRQHGHRVRAAAGDAGHDREHRSMPSRAASSGQPPIPRRRQRSALAAPPPSPMPCWQTRTRWATTTLDFSRLLANSSFTLPLDAAGTGGGGLFGNLTLWGSGDYRSISGGDPQSVGYDGSVTSANLGIDTRLGADMLAGVAVSKARGTVDYTASNASGELMTSLTSFNPYVGWQMTGGMNLWAMAGHGTGEVELDDESADAQSSDLTQRMVAAGASGPLVSSDEMIAGGTTNLNLKGEVAFTSADVDASGTLESMSLSASRQRLMFEGEHVRKLDSGADVHTLTRARRAQRWRGRRDRYQHRGRGRFCAMPTRHRG